MSWVILCESSDLAEQCLAVAESIGLAVDVRSEPELHIAALRSLGAGRKTAVVFVREPRIAELVELSHAARAREQTVGLALPAWSEQQRILLEVAGELGLCAVVELRPLCAALALLDSGGRNAAATDVAKLGPADRARLLGVVAAGKRFGAEFIAVDGQRLARVADASTRPVILGEAPAVRDALAALLRIEWQQTEVESTVEVDERAVLEVIFGPRRALSDPASKSALAPYGIPLPVEELCSSASRAAAEASRIGYPVRISLASPDLRVWDHPDLRVDMVDNAARVRDTFRQLFTLAQVRLAADPAFTGQIERRLLGVLVTATSEPLALLRVYATPLPLDRVAMRVGFADPHGRAAQDETITVLPAEAPVVERALRRLAGAALLFETRDADGTPGVDQVVDVLQRIAAFVNDRRQQIEAVELRPLAMLPDGSVEVREACVAVSNWFEQNS
jgi:hypothetical protein